MDTNFAREGVGIRLKPFSWSDDAAFCRNERNEVVYLRIKDIGMTLTLKYNNILDDDDLIDIADGFSGDDIDVSNLDRSVVSIRNPLLTDEQSGKMRYKEAIVNPGGSLHNFWKARNILPYQWIYVDNYRHIKSDTRTCVSCHHEIETKESNIFPSNHPDNLESTLSKLYPGMGKGLSSSTILFWDIESISPDRQFTDANKESDRIVSISVTILSDYKYTNYLLFSEALNKDLLPKDIVINIYNNESDLIMAFYSLWITNSPDKVVHYNGDSYDVPYIITRSKLNGIEIPFLGRTPPSSEQQIEGVKKIIIQTPMGTEEKESFDTPGVEIIDLVLFFRRFHPGLENYRLETIGRKFLGEGKTGLDIETMFEIIESKDPDRMAEVALYSYQDTLLLYRIWKDLNIEDTINNLSGKLLCSNEDILRFSDNEFVKRIFIRLDDSTSFSSFYIKKLGYTSEAGTKFYQNVSLYSYEYIAKRSIEIMMSGDKKEFVERLAKSISGLPCKLQMMVLYSSSMTNNYIDILINELSQKVPGIIAIDENYVWYSGNIEDASFLDSLFGKPKTSYKLYMSLSSESSIIVNSDNSIIRYGLNKISRHKYEFIRMIVDDYLTLIMNGIDPRSNKITQDGLGKVNPKLLVLSAKVKSINHYKPSGKADTVQRQLAKIVSSMGINIDTWLKVNYLNTTTGPHLILKDEDYNVQNIDIKKYVKDINSVYRTLDKILTSSL